MEYKMIDLSGVKVGQKCLTQWNTYRYLRRSRNSSTGHILLPVQIHPIHNRFKDIEKNTVIYNTKISTSALHYRHVHIVKILPFDAEDEEWALAVTIRETFGQEGCGWGEVNSV